MRTNVVLVGVVSLLGLSLSAGSAGGQEINATRFTNNLQGTEEVPPADLDGVGTAKITLRPAAGQVCYTVTFSSTGTPNRGHIHSGPAGANGTISVPLFELVGLPADPRNDALENRKLFDCVTVSPTLINEMIANPQGYYVNLHNTRFPNGAIRCQLQD